MAGNITTAYEWAISQCNNANVAYSQAYRNQQTVNGVTYYDCSSFVWYALLAGGFDVVGAYNSSLWEYTGNAITTDNMHDWLLALGFQELSVNNVWSAGDIVWRDGHTEMVYQGRVTMGAHSDSREFTDQVSINGSPSNTTDYTRLYRYGGGVRYDWIKGNRYLTLSEMQNNAIIIYSYFINKGWTLNAIAGVLGNMQTESTINPGIWQNLTAGSAGGGGWGLIQWTPWTKFTDWADSNGYAHDDGDAQLKWIDEETYPYHWVQELGYDMTFNEFKTSTETPEVLAYVYLYNAERPSDMNQPVRQTQARYWFDYLSGISPTPPVVKKKKKMPVWMMIRNF